MRTLEFSVYHFDFTVYCFNRCNELNFIADLIQFNAAQLGRGCPVSNCLILLMLQRLIPIQI